MRRNPIPATARSPAPCTGAKPNSEDTPPERDPADAALFAPRNLGQRIDCAVRAAIGFAHRPDRRHAALNPDATTLARLRNAMTAWYGARVLSRDAFRARFLDPSASDEVVDRLRAAARLAVEAHGHAELGQAGVALAEAVSQGAVPGVVKASGESGDIVLRAAFPPNRQGSGTQFPSSTAGVSKPAEAKGCFWTDGR